MLGRLRKRAARPEEPPTVEAATAGSEGHPKTHHISALRERRLLMSLRLVGLCLFAALTINLAQAFTLISLLPLNEVRPFLVRVSEEGDVAAAIEPIQDTFEAKNVLTEKLVREYVVNRHEILRSNAVMNERWSPSGYLGTTTAQNEYNRFRNRVSETLEQIRSQNARRRVEIISVSALRVGRVYLVDFNARSYDSNDQIIDEQQYTATVEIAFRQLEDLTRAQMLINPTGFTVVNYSLAERNQ